MSKLRVIQGGKTAPRPILMATYSILVPSNMAKEMEAAYEVIRAAGIPGTETPGKWWETCFLYGVKVLTQSALDTLQPKNPCGVQGHPATAFVIESEPTTLTHTAETCPRRPCPAGCDHAETVPGSGYCAICRDMAERHEQGGPASESEEADLNTALTTSDSDLPPTVEFSPEWTDACCRGGNPACASGCLLLPGGRDGT